MTSAEIFDIYNAAQLVELPAPTEGSTAVEVVSDPPELPPLSCTLNDAQACYDAHWLCSDGALSVAYPLDAPVESSSECRSSSPYFLFPTNSNIVTAPPDAAPTLLANQCPDSSNPSTDSGKTCAVGVGIAVNRPENDLPLIALTLMNENDDEVGETINIEMGINQEEKTGGLGPDVFWKLKPNSVPEEWPVDLDFRYDVESWNWLGCEFISQSNLGQDTIFESRRCEFPCHG